MKLRRTLLIAGVFAFLAMIYVPTPRHGYRFIFSQKDTSIAFFQLLVNFVFAALLGAILATILTSMSKRARYVALRVTAGCIAVVAVGVWIPRWSQDALREERRGEFYVEIWEGRDPSEFARMHVHDPEYARAVLTRFVVQPRGGDSRCVLVKRHELRTG